MADWAGKTLGKVHIDKLVARGGMAEVYKGNHSVYGQVAIKVMRGLLDTDSEHLHRFQREAEVVAELKHPNIVQMLEYVVVDETPCLIMDYVQGPSLSAYLKHLHEQKQRIPIGVVATLLRSISSALDYAHSKGIVHRDIKPANVLMRSPTHDIEIDQPLPLDVEPILTDFGLVRLLDSTMHTTTGSVSGTPAYMSPEQSRGEKVDKRTDIYSLGIMLYEMLAGGVPFQADTTFGMLMKHINEPPPPIKGVSADLQLLLDRALAKDPSMRYDSAGEFANEFLAVFNGQTISPGTLHFAQMARQVAAEAGKNKGGTPERPAFRWVRIGLESAIAIALAIVIYQFVRPTTTGVTANTPAVDVNIPVGRLRFSDFNNVMDRVTINLNNPTPPDEGLHYEAWLKNNSTTDTRNIGPMRITSSNAGLLEFTDPNLENLLKNFDEVFITLESDTDTRTIPSENIAYSSKFPTAALREVREILADSPETPDNLAIMQGLYYYSGSYINISINGNPLEPEFTGLLDAYQNNDEASLRKRTEEVINLIVGASSDMYRDYNNDGVLDSNDGDGFGSLANGDQSGYLQTMLVNVKQVSDAVDSTPNMRLYSENIQICVQNMEEWTNQLLPLAIQLTGMPFGPDMEAIVTEMSDLGDRLVRGTDTNQNDLVEPIAGECAASLAYEYGWYLADMSIFIGPDRVPPSGK